MSVLHCECSVPRSDYQKWWRRCFVLSPLRRSRTTGPASQTPQKYTFVHFSQTPGGGWGGGAVLWYFWYFWYVRQFSKSDNTNQHNGQQCCLAGGAHWNVDNQQLFTSRLPGQPHSFLLFCRVWSFYYYFKIPCNQFCQTWAGGLSRNKFPLRRAGCMTDPPTAPLCSLAGRGGERGRKYWILTVRENIAIKLNLLSSLINFKYRLDLTSTTSGRCLTPAVSSQSSAVRLDWHTSQSRTTDHWLQTGLLDQIRENKSFYCRTYYCASIHWTSLQVFSECL